MSEARWAAAFYFLADERRAMQDAIEQAIDRGWPLAIDAA